MELVFDTAEITVGDLEVIEELCGMTYEQMDFARPSAKLVKALIYITERRRNPAFTLEDAAQVRMGDITLGANPTADGGAS